MEPSENLMKEVDSPDSQLIALVHVYKHARAHAHTHTYTTLQTAKGDRRS